MSRLPVIRVLSMASVCLTAAGTAAAQPAPPAPPARPAPPAPTAARTYAQLCNPTLVTRGPVGPWVDAAPGIRHQKVWVRNGSHCVIAQGTIVVKGVMSPNNKEAILGLKPDAMNTMRPGETRTAAVVLKSSDWNKVRQVKIQLIDVVFLKPSGPPPGVRKDPHHVGGPPPHLYKYGKPGSHHPKPPARGCKGKRVFSESAGDWVRGHLLGFIWDPIITPLVALGEVLRTSRIREYRRRKGVRNKDRPAVTRTGQIGEPSEIGGRKSRSRKKKKKFLWTICKSGRIWPMLLVLCYRGHIYGPLYFAFGGNDKDVVTLLHFGFFLNPVGRTFYGLLQVGPVGNVVGKHFLGILQFGLAYNKAGGNLYGFGQIGLGYNKVGGNLYGFGQIGTGYNKVGGDLIGFGQIGVGYNRVGGDFRGLMQLGLVNSAGSFYGLAQLGLVNTAGRATSLQVGLYNDSDHMSGLKIGVALNRGGKLDGLAFSGLVNLHEHTRGLTIAPVLNYACKVHGVQIGLVNIGYTTRGLQIGLFNYARKMKGLQLGLVNIIRKGKLLFMVGANAGAR